MPSLATELRATFKRTIAAFGGESNGDGISARTIIASVAPAGDLASTIPSQYLNQRDNTITIKGRDDSCELTPGLAYRFFGRFAKHHRHGWQFEVRNFVMDDPHSRHGVIAYLKKFAPGIGTVIANRLFDRFAGEAVRVLRSDPVRAAAETKGLTSDAAREAAAALTLIAQTEDTRLELMDLFTGRGFPGKCIDAAIAKWGVAAPRRIRRDPFSMMVGGFPGAGFLRCDRLYLDLGNDPGRTKRQMLCLWYCLRSNTAGHTWHLVEEIRGEVLRLISSARVDLKRAVRMGLKAKWIACRRLAESNGTGKLVLAEHRKAWNERILAERVAELRSYPAHWPAVAGGKDGGVGSSPLSAHQLETVGKLLRESIAILAGTPGTGKTYTAAAIIRAIVDLHGRHDVAICAPTGKAAVRCTAAMLASGLTGIEATTIHRLLGVSRNGHDGEGWGFIAHRGNPLPQRWIIVDEVSMLDTDTAAALFDAIQPGSHVLLIGDPYQLPPVGHGAPFRDLIRAGLPYGELTEIQRNAGAIVSVCRAIKDGQRFAPPQRLDLARGDNVLHFDAASPSRIAAKVLSLMQSVPPGLDPVWDVQVITPTNEGGEIGRLALNKSLQKLLNADGREAGSHGFRERDKVICTANTMLPLLDANGEPERDVDGESGEEVEVKEFVANGEIGEVVSVEPKRIRVRFAAPERTVMVPLGSKKEKGDSVAGEGSEGGGGSASDFALAYAITCHKSQGSGWPAVIVVADPSRGAGMVASREWHYTAISRAEKVCFTVGERSTIDRQCRRVSLRERRTLLCELLQEASG